MDHLFVLDITMLIATIRAARELRSRAPTAALRAHWHYLHTEVKRATVAYLDTLAGADQAAEGGSIVAACRAAAVHEMPGAIACADELRAVLDGNGSLHALAMVHNDLWRLSHLEVDLREGGAALEDSTKGRDWRRVRRAALYIGGCVRRAVAAYGRASMRGAGDDPPSLRRARLAAARQFDDRCIDRVDGLAKLAADATSAMPIERGVARPLRHLRRDWAGALR